MISLFIDTSYTPVVGLLDESLSWLDYVKGHSPRSGQQLHAMIYEILSKNGMEFSEVKKLFMMAGPGSYTGMRVVEGFAQIVEYPRKARHPHRQASCCSRSAPKPTTDHFPGSHSRPHRTLRRN